MKIVKYVAGMFLFAFVGLSLAPLVPFLLAISIIVWIASIVLPPVLCLAFGVAVGVRDVVVGLRRH